MKVIRQGMVSLKLSEKDLLPRHDYIPRDAYRLALVDEYLGNTLSAAPDAISRFSPWLSAGEQLSASLKARTAIFRPGLRPGTA